MININYSKKIILAAIIVASAVFFIAADKENGASIKTGDAQNPAVKKIRVGVYDSRAVAVAYAPSKFNNGVSDLMTEYKEAEKNNDKEKMKTLKMMGSKSQDKLHMQGFGDYPVDDIMEKIMDSLPEVAKAANVDVITRRVAFSSPDVEIVDITKEIIKPFNPSDKTLKTIEELQKTKPLPFEKFPIKD